MTRKLFNCVDKKILIKGEYREYQRHEKEEKAAKAKEAKEVRGVSSFQ